MPLDGHRLPARYNAILHTKYRSQRKPGRHRGSQKSHSDADLASALIASGVTTQPVETVIAVLSSHRDGASINAAAKASGINYRTAQRIVEAASGYRERQLAVVS